MTPWMQQPSKAPHSDEESPEPRAEPIWDPMVPSVSEQEWELHGQMFKRIDALQNPVANTSHHVQDLVSLSSSPQDTLLTPSDTSGQQKTSLGDRALPDTLPWPPIVHMSNVSDPIHPYGHTSVLDCTQAYPTLLEHSKQCFDQLSPSAFEGSDHQGLAVPTPQEQSVEESTKVLSPQCHANLGVLDICGCE